MTIVADYFLRVKRLYRPEIVSDIFSDIKIINENIIELVINPIKIPINTEEASRLSTT